MKHLAATHVGASTALVCLLVLTLFTGCATTDRPVSERSGDWDYNKPKMGVPK